jgi:uncharacterized protein YyaL (SSP411 family)
VLFGALLIAAAPATAQTTPGKKPPPTSPSKTGLIHTREGAILWRPWDRSAFDEARRTGRLVLLHLTTSWSHSGHQMDLEAWNDTAVVQLVYRSYVPIRVDADRRPDIADRYLAGGWPTTAVLDPGGQMLGAQAVIGRDALVQMLTQLRDLYAKNRADVERRSAESARRVARTWENEAPVAPTMELDDWIDRNVSAVRDAEDREHGGVVGKPKTPQFETVRFLLAASAHRKDTSLRGLAFRILDAAMHLEDSTWGGFYRMAGEEDWKRPRTEKLLDVNARALGALVSAVDAGGGARYRDAARRTEAYAATWLGSPRGGWYGSQDADVPRKDGTLLAGEVYYSLRDELRKKQGLPVVDSSLYADANARMASVILRGAQTGIWKGAAVARAVKAMDRLWSEQRAKDGSLYHEWRNGTRAVPGRLGDQAVAGQAYLEAYAATKEPRHLARAESLAVWIRNRLEDKRGGGFRYAPRDPNAIGRLAAGEKPEAGNLETAWFYLRFWELKRRPEDRRSAQRALDSLRSGEVVALDPAQAELGLRLEQAASVSP